jgi:putative spermidine/putrescine transport system permease protein
LVPALIFLAIFFVVPIIDLIWRSLSNADGASLDQYRRVFSDSYYVKVIGQTFLLSAVVTGICIVAGYPVAYFLVRRTSRWQSAVVFVLLMPLLTSLIMRTYGWQIVLGRRGIVNSLLSVIGVTDQPLHLLQTYGAVVLGMVHLYVPFVVISIATVLQGIDRGIEEAAVSLGASWPATFFKITLPLSMDGVMTGGILVFMMANGAFVTALLLGGNSVITIPLLIYQQFTIMRDFRFGAVLSTLLLGAATVCLFIQLHLVSKTARQ